MKRFKDLRKLISYKMIDTRECVEPNENEELYFAVLGRDEFIIHTKNGEVTKIINFIEEVAMATLA